MSHDLNRLTSANEENRQRLDKFDEQWMDWLSNNEALQTGYLDLGKRFE